MTPYQTLLQHYRTLVDLRAAASVLRWDQQTQMPPGGAAGRARQLATLSRMEHELHTSETTARLLEAARDAADPTSDEARAVAVLQEDYDRATRFPAAFVAELTQLVAMSHGVWAKARAESDFSQFAPVLAQLVAKMQQAAEYMGYDEHPYDGLLKRYERGMTTADVTRIFDGHRARLVALVDTLSRQPQVDDSFLHQPFDRDKQRAFALDIVQKFGFDMSRGVQAVSVHPFCTSFGVNDVRITTRFYDNFLNPALFGMMHEAGHAMYEQGSAQELDGTPLAGGTSLGVHESQSRLWENIVGRSAGFWSWALPKLQQTFPQLARVSLEAFVKGINKVQRSFIRVEADEATYNLHIMLRFDLEKDILTGKIRVQDLPKEWNGRFEEYLGITPPDDAQGVLQDVHWSSGLMGYFPTYALGNLLSVQYYNAALAAHPSIPDDIAQGKFDTLLSWLRVNIHQHGRKYTAAELTQRITGGDIDSTPYMDYLERKFKSIYGL